MSALVESMLGAVGGVAGLVAVAGLLVKVWPGVAATVATWLYAHLDPNRLPYGSEANRHWAQQREIAETQHEIQEALRETQRDIIKNTILQLIRDGDADHTSEVAYELSKLESLDSQCWVMDVARDYITEHNH